MLTGRSGSAAEPPHEKRVSVLTPVTCSCVGLGCCCRLLEAVDFRCLEAPKTRGTGALTQVMIRRLLSCETTNSAFALRILCFAIPITFHVPDIVLSLSYLVTEVSFNATVPSNEYRLIWLLESDFR